ncbi:MAG: hypothetical protein [Arizlama microvirus]|nr:MAG: hypothetical protein [Arizlama microvirus]
MTDMDSWRLANLKAFVEKRLLELSDSDDPILGFTFTLGERCALSQVKGYLDGLTEEVE